MGLDEVYKKCSEPKETNRQIGPMFKDWIDKGSLGKKPVEIDEFINTSGNAILSGNDKEMGILQKIIVDMNMLETLIKVWILLDGLIISILLVKQNF